MWRITKPFVNITPGEIPRACLEITITNPHTGLKIKTLGLIDTGADECAMPASYAKMLGHNLEKGKSCKIMTGNGPSVCLAASGVVARQHRPTHQRRGAFCKSAWDQASVQRHVAHQARSAVGRESSLSPGVGQHARNRAVVTVEDRPLLPADEEAAQHLTLRSKDQWGPKYDA